MSKFHILAAFSSHILRDKVKVADWHEVMLSAIFLDISCHVITNTTPHFISLTNRFRRRTEPKKKKQKKTQRIRFSFFLAAPDSAYKIYILWHLQYFRCDLYLQTVVMLHREKEKGGVMEWRKEGERIARELNVSTLVSGVNVCQLLAGCDVYSSVLWKVSWK